MWEMIVKGGWVMIPIIGGSIIALGLFAERLWALRRSRVNPPDFLRQILILIRKGQWSEARILSQRDAHALARLSWLALSSLEHPRSRQDLKEIVEEAGSREAFFLERGIGSLGMIASLEPLLGLLGTVLGMIAAFRQVEIGGVGDPRVVASGVWIALLTTAAGLIAAIPAYIGYRFLLARVDRMILDLQSDIGLIIDTSLQQLDNSPLPPASPSLPLPPPKEPGG